MNVIFLGTPEFAVPALKKITESKHKVLAVISQPDRETDKKGNLIFTPVKKEAIKNNIPVYQFEKVSFQGLDLIKKLKPDVMVTAAFGQLLSEEFLSLAKYGVFNIHASVLPKFRGSSPIQNAILSGEKETGLTVMKTVLKMDAGDIVKIKKCPISDETTFLELHDKLSQIGAELIIDVLDDLENNNITFIPQNEYDATYTKKIVKSDGVIDWSDLGFNIIRKINAFNPWPAAFTFYKGENLKIFSAKCVEDNSHNEAGTIIFSDADNGLIVKCRDGAVKIENLQAPGKKAMNVFDFLRGYKINAGDKFDRY